MEAKDPEVWSILDRELSTLSCQVLKAEALDSGLPFLRDVGNRNDLRSMEKFEAGNHRSNVICQTWPTCCSRSLADFLNGSSEAGGGRSLSCRRKDGPVAEKETAATLET
jgi:hypothetical protein